ncbi:MAG: hypothetical protein ABJC89_14735 [Acidobacteriota bacterium]
MIRCARLLPFSLALVFAGLAGVAEAQNPPYWGQDSCLYSWNGRAYTTSLCRVVRPSYVVDYWNPRQRQWLVRITDNPANRYIDYQFMQGPSIGWSLRSLRARPGEAVPLGPIAFKSPQGVWTATPTGTAWTNLTTNTRATNPTLAGCPPQPQYGPKTPLEKRCNDAMGAFINAVEQGSRIRRTLMDSLYGSSR